MTTYEKAPSDIELYGGTWADYLLEGETIVASSWTMNGTGLTIGSGAQAPGFSGALTSVWLLGGTNGRNYCVSNTIETSLGRKKTGTIQIQVRAACCAA